MRVAGRIIAVAAVVVLLSACAIKPDALTSAQIDAFTGENVAAVTAGQEPLRGPIDLYEAMARALKYNLDFKIEMMNEALAARSLDLKSAAMLPQLVANSGYDGRSNDSGGVSKNIQNGNVPAMNTATTSTEREVLTANAQLSWNILDFGLSYVRARQSADEVLIAEERRRKVVNRIIEDVRAAYWRAASAQRLISGLGKLEKRVEAALKGSRALVHEGAQSPLTALAYERELLDIRKQIHELMNDMQVARYQLATLMNLAPGANYSIAAVNRNGVKLKLNQDVGGLIDIALRNRPELRETQLKQRISFREADAALLEMLPGINVFAGVDVSSNDLLYNASWVSWGAKASWNAMRVFTYPLRKNQIAANDELLHQQALATTMAVMTQVHVARVRFYQLTQILKDAADYHDVQARMLEQVRVAAKESAASEQSLIREEMNTLVASARYDIAYADLQNSFANVYASIGIDPYEAGLTGAESVRDLASSLRNTWVERGDRSGAGAKVSSR